jgi:hypothetical protein
MNIAEVIPQDNYVLHVKSEDGKAGLFDVKPYLDSEAFSPLKDKAEFERVHNGKYFIEWECGADLSADSIQARCQTIPNNVAQPSAPTDSVNAPLLS